MEETRIAAALQAWSSLLGSWHCRDIGYTPDRVWEIASERGDLFVLKEIRYDFERWPNPVARFVEEARILAWLSSRRVPVAVPIAADDGRIVSAVSDRLYALTPKLRARRAAPDRPDSEAATHFNIGAAAARLHQALAACPYLIESERIADRRIGAPDNWSRLRRGVDAGVFEELSDRLAPWLSRIDEALAQPCPQRVHGDLHGANILVDDDDNITGIVDLDKLPIAPRIYDLAYLLMFSIEWAYQQHETVETIKAGTRLKAQHLIAGYASVAALSVAELEALPAMAIHTAFGKINFFLTFTGSVSETWLDTLRLIIGHPEALKPSQIDEASPHD